ncbi:hypothetical protein T492DRAFT_901380 [Pavlovales sp. CCMP2436]|nr:hypothetical protein T492DRAFT_901380 [Pavlovales sp. CCMP2436]
METRLAVADSFLDPHTARQAAWVRGCVEEARLPGSPWFAMSERLEHVAASWLLRAGGTGMSKLHVRPRYEDPNRRPWDTRGEERYILPAAAAAGVEFEVADLVDALVLTVAAEATERDGRPPPAVLDESAKEASSAPADGMPTQHARLEAALQVLGASFARNHFPAVQRRPHLLEPPYLTRPAATRLKVAISKQFDALFSAELLGALETAAAPPGVPAPLAAGANPAQAASRVALAARSREYRAHVASLASDALENEVGRALGTAPARRGIHAASPPPPRPSAAAERAASRAALGDGIAGLLALRGGGLDASGLEPLRAAAVALPGGLRRLVWSHALLRSASAAERENGGVGGSAPALVKRTAARIGRNVALSGLRGPTDAPLRSLHAAAVLSAFGAEAVWRLHAASDCHADAGAAGPADAGERTARRQLVRLRARAVELLSADHFAGPDPLDTLALNSGPFAAQPLAAEGAAPASLAGPAPALSYAWRELPDAELLDELPKLVALLRELRSPRALGGLATLARAAQAVGAVARAQPRAFEDMLWLAMRFGATGSTGGDAAGSARGGSRVPPAEPPAVRTASEAVTLIARVVADEWLPRGLCSVLHVEAAAWAWDQCALAAVAAPVALPRADGDGDGDAPESGWEFLLEVCEHLLGGLGSGAHAARAAREGWPALRALLVAPQPKWTADALRRACFPELHTAVYVAAASRDDGRGRGGVPRLQLAKLVNARALACVAAAAEQEALSSALAQVGRAGADDAKKDDAKKDDVPSSAPQTGRSEGLSPPDSPGDMARSGSTSGKHQARLHTSGTTFGRGAAGIRDRTRTTTR